MQNFFVFAFHLPDIYSVDKKNVFSSYSFCAMSKARHKAKEKIKYKMTKKSLHFSLILFRRHTKMMTMQIIRNTTVAIPTTAAIMMILSSDNFLIQFAPRKMTKGNTRILFSFICYNEFYLKKAPDKNTGME